MPRRPGAEAGGPALGSGPGARLSQRTGDGATHPRGQLRPPQTLREQELHLGVGGLQSHVPASNGTAAGERVPGLVVPQEHLGLVALGGDDHGRPGGDGPFDDGGQPRLLGGDVADPERPQHHGLGQGRQQCLQARRGDAGGQVDDDDVVAGVGGGVLPAGPRRRLCGPLPRGAGGGQWGRIGRLETGEGP